MFFPDSNLTAKGYIDNSNPLKKMKIKRAVLLFSKTFIKQFHFYMT